MSEYFTIWIPPQGGPLILVVEKQLLEVHTQAIIDKGFEGLISQHRHEDLARMFSLLNRVNGLDKVKLAFNQYIKNVGTSLVTDPEKDGTLVQDLLDFRAKLDFILENSFQRKESFASAIKEAFEAFMNARQNKPAELIAQFLHEKLRSNKIASEEELESLFDKVMVLFRYIQGKDIFEAFYKNNLAKRLLLGKMMYVDAEKSMISKLKTECGCGYTKKLEGMFKDMETAKDIMNSFKQSPFASQVSNIDLNVQVLTVGYWPAWPQMEIKMPDELVQLQETFTKFYSSQYRIRRLTWQSALGHCVIKAQFPSGRKELDVSLHQAVVLLLFNNTNQLTFKELINTTGLEKKELVRVLVSLSGSKVKILAKQSKTKEVSDDDVFSFNKEFSNKLFKIKINSFQIQETVEENQKTTEGVFQDRQYQIDAALVRIMKTRKTLSHNLLVSELVNQLKFPMKPADIKKRIESLIERDYLERDANNAQVYNYLA
eukprot:TRINITY_DN4711_c0_g1_i1.p1 TRINITY_DN4711_c0_g1~~TRINITY_DN4711_c0_g1_i1.p1  ORF type:complete len:487 (-),score=139.06 TRINITY_DN4711_c0_g1_i1:100-1560(-)